MLLSVSEANVPDRRHSVNPIKSPTDAWLMTAFVDQDEFPLPGFLRARSGCWYIKLPTRQSAISIKKALIDLGIRYRCRKIGPAKEIVERIRTKEERVRRDQPNLKLELRKQSGRRVASDAQKRADKIAAWDRFIEEKNCSR